jgi:hypothetical protein
MIHTLTLRRTPLDELSARPRNLYLTKHNTYKRDKAMPLAGFEPTIPASERPQALALDRAVTGFGLFSFYGAKCSVILVHFRGCNLIVKQGIIIQRFGWRFLVEETNV